MSSSSLTTAKRAERRMILGGGDAGLFTFLGPSRHAAPPHGVVRLVALHDPKAAGAKPTAHAQIDRAPPR
jgi:hypothetical protein|tara:strand:- start:407 stop:616 length:210 start_codon:yes stop_codon:yes gene_type:complete